MQAQAKKDSRRLALSGSSHFGETYELFTAILYHPSPKNATPFPHIFTPARTALLTESVEAGIILVLSPIRYSQSGEVVKGLGLRLIFHGDGRGRHNYIPRLQVA